MTYRGHVNNGVVLLDNGVTLPEGAEVLITPLSPQPGTSVALLAAMAAEPHLAKEDVEELEQAIARGRRPLGLIAPFPEGPQGTEIE